MDQQIKALTELDKLLTETTSPTVLKPDLAKFKRMSEILNSRTNLPKEFVKVLRSKIMSLKQPRSQLMLFELMEFTTCKCPGPLHTEYNNKEFLQVLNSVFNQAQLSDEVRNKLLSLIQFWNHMFESRRDIYPNFSWYYNLIQSRGVPFPPIRPSPYLESKQSFGQPSAPARGPSGFDAPSSGGLSRDDAMFETLDPKQKKLFSDLRVVLENVNLANSMMDQNERDMDEVIASIAKMQNKLQPLPERLLQANEGFLHAFCTAIIEDTGFTLNRYQRYLQRQPAPKFNSQAEQIIEQARQMFAQQAQPQPQPPQPQFNDFGGPQFVEPTHSTGTDNNFGGFGQPQHPQGAPQDQFGFEGAFGQPPQQPHQGFEAQQPAQHFDQAGFGGQDFGFGGQPSGFEGHQQAQQNQGGVFWDSGAHQQAPAHSDNKQSDPFGGF